MDDQTIRLDACQSADCAYAVLAEALCLPQCGNSEIHHQRAEEDESVGFVFRRQGNMGGIEKEEHGGYGRVRIVGCTLLISDSGDSGKLFCVFYLGSPSRPEKKTIFFSLMPEIED